MQQADVNKKKAQGVILLSDKINLQQTKHSSSKNNLTKDEARCRVLIKGMMDQEDITITDARP